MPDQRSFVYKNNFYSAVLSIGMLTILQQSMVAVVPSMSSSDQDITDSSDELEAASQDNASEDDSEVLDDSGDAAVDSVDATVAPVQVAKEPVVPEALPVAPIAPPLSVVVPVAVAPVPIAPAAPAVAPLPPIPVAPPPVSVAVVADVPVVLPVNESVVRTPIKSAATSFEVALKQVQEKTFEGLKKPEETPDEKAVRLKRFQNHMRKAMASKMAKAKTAAKHVFAKNAAGVKVAVVKAPVGRNDGRKPIVRKKKHAVKNKKNRMKRKNPVTKNPVIENK